MLELGSVSVAFTLYMYYSDLLVQEANETSEPLSYFKITEYVYFSFIHF